MTTLTQQTIPGTDLTTAPLVLGGNTFGWTTDREQSFAVLDAFVEAGGTLIDTADVYASWAPGLSGGESEKVLGAWLAERGRPEGVTVATKAGMLAGFDKQDRATATAALDNSLQRLGVERVELFYAHQDDEATPIEEQAETYDSFVRAGKVGHVALSNYSPERMRTWFQHAKAEGLAVPVAIQPQYNLVSRAGYEQGHRAIAEEFGPAVFPYFGLASGFLTGKYRSAEDLKGRDREGFISGYATEDGFAVVEALVSVAEQVGAAPASVALAWLLAKGVTAPIASARTPEQLKDLVAAATLTLDAEHVAALDKASEPFA